MITPKERRALLAFAKWCRKSPWRDTVVNMAAVSHLTPSFYDVAHYFGAYAAFASMADIAESLAMDGMKGGT